MRSGFLKRTLIERVLVASCGTLAASGLFTLMVLTVLDVIGRKWFQNSLQGALELTEILMALIIFSGLSLVSWRDEHVVFNAFDRLLPAWLRRWQLRTVHVVCVGTFLMLAWLMFNQGLQLADYGQVTAQLRIPMGAVAILMSGLLVVVALAHLLLAIFWPEPTGAGRSPQAPAKSAPINE